MPLPRPFRISVERISLEISSPGQERWKKIGQDFCSCGSLVSELIRRMPQQVHLKFQKAPNPRGLVGSVRKGSACEAAQEQALLNFSIFAFRKQNCFAPVSRALTCGISFNITACISKRLALPTMAESSCTTPAAGLSRLAVTYRSQDVEIALFLRNRTRFVVWHLRGNRMQE